MDGYCQALTNYRPLRYSHVKVGPGEDYVLTADPWSYLHGFLIGEGVRHRGQNRENRERAVFYLRLAQNFYRASEAAEMPAKSTLLYYGMLNLVKVWLSVLGTRLETTHETHGLTLPPSRSSSVVVQSITANQISIFGEFAKALGTPVSSRTTVSLKNALAQIPELHAARMSFDPNLRQHFIRVGIEFLTDANHDELIAVMSYMKKTEGIVGGHKIYRGARARYFEAPRNIDDRVYLQSRRTRWPSNWDNLSISYSKFLREFDEFDICSILTREGYRHFLNLKPGEFHHLCYTLLVMHFLGTAARYRPTMMNDILEGNLRQAVTEACAICPRQFLYHLASRITERECVIPFAEI